MKDKYTKQAVPEMVKKYSLKSPMAVPCVEKIVINSGMGKTLITKGSSEKKKLIEEMSNVLAMITGQKPNIQKARISVSTFKLRKGMPIGLKVTLRKKRMYDFLEKLILLILPRTRDFRGIDEKSVDKQGNLTFGFKEYSAFPEVVAEREKGIFGFEITIVTTGQDREKSVELLKLMGFPFKKNG